VNSLLIFTPFGFRKNDVEDWVSFIRNFDWQDLQMQKAIQWKKLAEEDKRQKEVDSRCIPLEAEVTNLLGIFKVTKLGYNKFECQKTAEDELIKQISGSKLNEEEETEDITGGFNQYLQFLEKMVKRKDQLRMQKQKYGKKFRRLELSVSPNMPKGMLYHLDPTGLLRVSAQATPEEVFTILQSQGPKAVELSRQESDWESIRNFSEVRLGLKSLTVDYSFFYSVPNSLARSRHAFKRLQEIVDTLRTSFPLSGRTLAISDHYGLGAHDAIFIKWDFRSDDVVLLLQGVDGSSQKQPEKQQPRQEEQQELKE